MPECFKDHILIAHNALFEQLVLKHCLGWDVPPVASWVDTALLCSVCNIPRSLKEAAKFIGLREQKQEIGTVLINKLSKPNRKGEFVEDAEAFEKLCAYCEQDVRTTVALYQHLCTMRPVDIRGLLCVDADINATGIPVDLELVKASQAAIDTKVEELNKRVEELTEGKLQNTNSRNKMIALAKELNYNLPNYTKDTVVDAIADPKCPELLRELLQIRKLTGLASVKKLKTILEVVWPDGTVKDTLQLCGAGQTGRWAGRKVQVQNFTKAKHEDIEDAIPFIKSGDLDMVELLWGKTHDVVSQLMRSMICAPEGKTFIAMDYANIEGRVLAWLAGQTDLIIDFANGQDIYKDMAAKIYGKDVEDITKQERTFGKVCCLGLGYGMGAKRFIEHCSSWGMEITDDFAQRAVNIYRESNYNVTKLWRKFDEAFRRVLIHEDAPAVQGVEFNKKDGFVYVTLPSGRRIYYNNPRLTCDGIEYNGKLKTHGAKIVENVVQAIARDLLAFALIDASMRGLDVRFHVHDEIVILCDKENADREYGMLQGVMRRVPEWAEGLPLEVDGWVNERYKK
jgi:DNA polymerase